MKKNRKSLAIVTLSFIAASLIAMTVVVANSQTNSNELASLDKGDLIQLDNTSDLTLDGKCGDEGKCGEGKCGEDKSEAKAEKKADKKEKCGEAKSGDEKSEEKAKCGEGKCGEGKCGK